MDVTACCHTTYFHVFITQISDFVNYSRNGNAHHSVAYIILKDLLTSSMLYFVHILRLDMSGARSLLLSAPFYEFF